jgi:hypothetical protein
MVATNLVAAVYSYRRAPNKAAFASTWAVAVAIITVADWIVYGIFDLYRYHPGLFTSDKVDGAIGMLLADLIYVPAMTTLMLQWFPVGTATVLNTTVFTALEGMFLQAGLFTHKGWRLWYTAALFPFYGTALGYYFHAATQRPAHPWVRAIRQASLAHNGMAILTLVHRMAHVVYTNLHIFPEYLANQALGRILTYGLGSSLLGWWVLSGAREVRGARLTAFTLTWLGINWLFEATGFQHFLAPLTWWLDALIQGAVVWVACVVDNRIERLQTEERQFVR